MGNRNTITLISKEDIVVGTGLPAEVKHLELNVL